MIYLKGFFIQHLKSVQTLFKALNSRQETFCLSESCTGGGISSLITDVYGSSRYFIGSVVSYSLSAKIQLLGVPEKWLKTKGAENSETALFMARGVKSLLKGDWGLSITGRMDRGGGKKNRVFIGLASPKNEEFFTEYQILSQSRSEMKQEASMQSLDFFISKLTN